MLRITGLAGIFVGANAKPPWPQIVFVVFAAMVGLDQFIERLGGKRNGNGDKK